jgi:hypothetical protein
MRVECEGKQMQLPDFLIVGAPRSGTTALYHYIQGHPNVYLPAQKEPMFFCDLGDNIHIESEIGLELVDWIIRDLDDYVDLFRKARHNQVIGEASTGYLREHKSVIPNIQALYGQQARDLKIIIMLRHPADRTWSHYSYNRIYKQEFLPFHEAIRPNVIQRRIDAGAVPSYDIVGVSRYANQIRPYRKAFPATRIFIFEEFYRDLESGMKQVAEFLGIPMHPALLSGKVVNPSGRPRSDGANRVIRGILRDSWWKRALKTVVSRKMSRKLKLGAIKHLIRPERIDPAIRAELCDLFSAEIRAVEQELERAIPAWHAEGHVP